MRRWVLLSFLLLLPSTAFADDFYVDPESGSMDGDGSAGAPWRTLEEVIAAGLVETQNWASHPPDDTTPLEPRNAGAPVGPGDTLWLRSGYHGELLIEGAYNESPITIAAEEGATPQFRSVTFRGAAEWVLRGVSISPSFAEPYDAGQIVTVNSHNFQGPSHHIAIEDCRIFSVEDISGWSASDWVSNAPNGIGSNSADTTVRGNVIENVDFGISMSGDRARVVGNSVRNFSGDGLRGLGDDGWFEGNYIANCYDVDDNHDDGFQSWSVGEDGVGSGSVRGMTIRGNTIVNYEDPDQPLRGPLQGIGCFDGFFDDWVVENNVIVVDHWHGITLLGARNSRVVNNTVIDPNDERPGPPWIQFGDHKDGTASTGNLVRNNLTTSVSNEAADTTEDHNVIIEDPTAHFVGPAFPYDLHLLQSSPALDTGSADQSPDIDREGFSRPQGAAHDIGAYEWHEPGVEPVTDAGTPPLADGGPTGGDAGPAVMDGGPVRGDDAGTGGDPEESGCGCRAAGAPLRGSRYGYGAALLAIGLFVTRRRATSRP